MAWEAGDRVEAGEAAGIGAGVAGVVAVGSAVVVVLGALVAAVLAVAARAEAGEVGGISMTPEKLIDEFVRRLRATATSNLESVILYGSAASNTFDPEFSNINLLCVLKDTAYSSLRSLGPAMEWWYRQEQVAPLVMSKEELARSTDVFTIELLDIVRHHRVLFGEDVLAALTIRTELHRVQVEYELREKLLLLRRSVLLAARNKDRLWDVLLGSLASFSTLFRHALIAIGEEPPESKREAVAKLAARVNSAGDSFLRVLDVREHKVKRKALDVEQLCAGYLGFVEQVTAAVDRILDSAA